MSSISSVSSAASQYQSAGQNSIGPIAQSFQSIGSALQSGDLSRAQGALASFQQKLETSSPSSASQPFGKSGPASTDYQTLTTALKSGDLSSAQQAYSSLQADLKGTQSTHRGHHHHGSGTVAAGASTSGYGAVPNASSAAGANSGGLNVTA